MAAFTTDEWIAKAFLVHGDSILYGKVEYVNKRTHVLLECPAHGEFWQDPHSHLQGKGCPDCGHIKGAEARIGNTHRRSKQKDVIARFEKTHKRRYDYSKVVYKNMHAAVCI